MSRYRLAYVGLTWVKGKPIKPEAEWLLLR